MEKLNDMFSQYLKCNWPVIEQQQLALCPAWPRHGGTGWESSSDLSLPSPAGPAPLSQPDPPAVDLAKSGATGINCVE